MSCSVYNHSLLFCAFQTRMALEKGAQAVIFDVSDDAKAAAEVGVQAQLELQQRCRNGITIDSVVISFSSYSYGTQNPFSVQSCWWRLTMQRS